MCGIICKYGGDDMAKKILISFGENELEEDLLNWLEEKSKLLGKSGYIKQILYEIKLKEDKEKLTK